MVEHFRRASGFVLTPWCGSAEDELKVKELTTATTRVIPTGSLVPDAACAVCGKPAVTEVIWAKAY